MQKCRFFAGQIVAVLFVFIQIPASIVINFFFPTSPRHFSPPAATMEPPRRGMIGPASSASVWAFVISPGRHGEGAAFRTPSLLSRLTMSPGCLSREFWAVFPAGRKNRTNWRHFSCRQETLSLGLPTFNPLSAPSPRSAAGEKCRNSRVLRTRCRGFEVSLQQTAYETFSAKDDLLPVPGNAARGISRIHDQRRMVHDHLIIIRRMVGRNDHTIMLRKTLRGQGK